MKLPIPHYLCINPDPLSVVRYSYPEQKPILIKQYGIIKKLSLRLFLKLLSTNFIVIKIEDCEPAFRFKLFEELQSCHDVSVVYLLVQLNPSPVYPSSHEQLYDPLTSEQVPLLLQLCVPTPVSHSSISTK